MERIGDAPDLRCRGSSWFIPYETILNRGTERGRHPATFPVALAEMCIKLSGVPKGSLVYDPFAGTGTTLVAARALQMRGVGTEIDAGYVDHARRRLADCST
ncbi:MAG: site-specific DNA-methyltransferase [Planctomycetota bacterium]